MRLSNTEIKAIKDTIYDLDKDAKVYLFGSRTKDELRGGDIDLLILSAKITFQDKLKLKYKLYEKIGEQKIDIIVTEGINDPFVKIVYSNGVLLNG